jgi:hypothetical protein
MVETFGGARCDMVRVSYHVAAEYGPEIFDPHKVDDIEFETLEVIRLEVDKPHLESARQKVWAWVKSRGRESEPTAALEQFAAFLAEVSISAEAPLFKTPIAHKGGQVVIGPEKIAAETRRTPAGVLRLIEGGKLPTASVAGQHVSTKDILRPHRRYGASAIAA